jgi:hypothetical protein
VEADAVGGRGGMEADAVGVAWRQTQQGDGGAGMEACVVEEWASGWRGNDSSQG